MTKDRTLKDVTNKLDPKPAKLEPIWAGLKSANGSGMKVAGIVNKWVKHGPEASPSEVGPGGRNDNTLKCGPLPCRPPDPALSSNRFDALTGNHINLTERDCSIAR